MKLIGISGPPRSGKDTFAGMLRERFRADGLSVAQSALSYPMRKAIYGMLGVVYSTQHYEEHKDDPQALFCGHSIRREMIELSERHMKPRLGKTFWGRALVNHLEQLSLDLVIVADIGFQDEVGVFEEWLGPENCAWVQMHREGHDFSKDSRSYCSGKHNNSTVENNGDFGLLKSEALRIYGRCLNNYGWAF